MINAGPKRNAVNEIKVHYRKAEYIPQLPRSHSCSAMVCREGCSIFQNWFVTLQCFL